MALVNVNRITNANVYVNGVSLLGMAAEVTVPRPKAKLSEHKGLGMVGTLEVPSGLDKLEAKIKWQSLYLAAELTMSSIYQTRQYQVRANVETYSPMGLIAQTPAIWLLSGAVKDPGELVFKQHDNVEATTTLTVYAVTQVLAGVPVFIYDVFANIYVVDGVDQLAAYRANLGG